MKTEITKEEFCRETHTSADCWMFREMNPKACFYKDTEGDPVYYYFDNGISKVRRFADMQKYDEVWVSSADRIGTEVTKFGIWSTWTQYSPEYNL